MKEKRIKEKSAKGVRGFLLYNPFTKNHFFRIHNSKNPTKFKKYHNNFKVVRQKIVEVEERDHVRNFQPPISGEEIMAIFNLKPSREIGVLKEAIKEAILEGEIPNDYKAAYAFMIKRAEKLGLQILKN